MVILARTVKVRPDKMDEAVQIVKQLVQVREQQYGIPVFLIGAGQMDPATFVFYEVHHDEEAQRGSISRIPPISGCSGTLAAPRRTAPVLHRGRKHHAAGPGMGHR